IRSQPQYVRHTVSFRHDCSMESPEKSRKSCCTLLNSCVPTYASSRKRAKSMNESFSRHLILGGTDVAQTSHERRDTADFTGRIHPSLPPRKGVTDGKSYSRTSAGHSWHNHAALLAGGTD